MDDFKLNAAKIIAAQQKKTSRAQSPDSVSNWDSSEPEDTDNKVSSGEEISTRSTRSQKDRKSTLQGKQPKKGTSSSTPKKRNKEVRGTPSKEQNQRTGTLSKKQNEQTGTPFKGTDVNSAGMRKGVNSFVDRQADSPVEETRDIASRSSRKLRDDDPPYDFSAALGGKVSNRGSAAEVRPGQSRKNNHYNIPEDPPKQKRKGSWDESDEDERIVMEEMRGAMEDQGRETIATSSDRQEESMAEGSKHKFKWSLNKKKSADNTGNDIKAMNTSQQHLIANSGGFDTTMYDSKDLSVAEVSIPSGDETVEETSIRKGVKDGRYIYHFHQGSTRYFDTRNRQEEVYMSTVADKSEKLVRRCISEVLSTLRIGVDFFLILFLELLRFLVFRIIGAFLVGTILIFGDFLLKPFLASCFNSICQPIAAICYNCSVACRTNSLPLRDALTALCTPCVMLLRAFRVVEINWNSHRITDTQEV